jgi:probable HAF family extracellular repeat protein
MRKLHTIHFFSRSWQLLVLAALIVASTTSYAGTYTLTDLGIPSGTSPPLRGMAISSTGAVVGYDAPGAGFVIAGATSSILVGALPGSSSGDAFAVGINASGTIVGGAVMNGQSPDGFTINHAFVYNAGSWIDLTPPGLYAATATGINAAGQVTISNPYGILVLFSDTTPVCFVYSPGNGTAPSATNNIGALGSPGAAVSGGLTECSALNNSGQVTGASAPDLVTPPHAFVYTPGNNSTAATMNDLGGLQGGDQSFGLSINDAGDVAGWATTCGDSCWHAFVYHPAKPGTASAMIDLGTLPNGSDGPSSTAYGINNSGQVVGSSGVGTSMQVDGFLYDGSAMFDLNTLIPPSAWMSCFVTLTKGDAINDSGTILADGTNSCTGVQHVYLLQPPTSNPPANPCASTFGVDGRYILCHLPSFVAVCGLDCVFSTLPVIQCPECQYPVQVSWNAPGFSDDHWADGTSLTLRLPNVERARFAANALQFTMSTESSIPSFSKRTIRVAPLTSGGSAESRSTTIVAPIVEISAANSLEPRRQQSLFGTRGRMGFHLTLPYHLASAQIKTKARLVTFDKDRHVWVEVANQSLNASKHLITARLVALGQYTIVATSSPAK